MNGGDVRPFPRIPAAKEDPLAATRPWKAVGPGDSWQLALFEHFAAVWDAGDCYTLAMMELIAEEEGDYTIIGSFDRKQYAIPKAWITRKLVHDMYRLWSDIQENARRLAMELKR